MIKEVLRAGEAGSCGIIFRETTFKESQAAYFCGRNGQLWAFNTALQHAGIEIPLSL